MALLAQSIQLDLKATIGVTFHEDLTISTDLTGVAMKMQIRKKSDDSVMMELSTDNGGIKIYSTSESLSEFSLHASYQDVLDNLELVAAKYDLICTSAPLTGYTDPFKEELLTGQFIIDKSTTQ